LRKGSVFTEFAELESVDKFVNADPKPTFEGQELVVMTKYGIFCTVSNILLNGISREAYCDMKIKEKGLTGKAADQKRNNIRRGGFDAFKEMKEGEKSKAGPELVLDFMGKMIKVHEDESGVGYVKEEDIPTPKSGSMLKFEGCDENATLKFSHIKVRELAIWFTSI
jgi:lupus La protein